MKILVIEDDGETADDIAHTLQKRGHWVIVAPDGNSGLALGMTMAFDLLIVDRRLPGLDGLSLVRTIRDKGSLMPVLFLSALSGIDDRVAGLNGGGDDYLSKPFAVAELIARVEALGRRASLGTVPSILAVADLVMDLVARTVSRAGRPIELLPREWQLLEFLLRHSGQVVTKSMLLEHVWGTRFDPGTSVVETHVSRMRKKVDEGFGLDLINTVRGVGYCLRAGD
ncbi:MAG: response regulator transcription factor [Alphaproteobacteria bacterium]|nr:response regulator transcription factor [Alphaproteobacteria bacterium]